MWSRNGKELFYLSAAGPLMAVKFEGAGTTPQLENPTRFGSAPRRFFVGAEGRSFDVSPDGNRFIVIKERTAETPESRTEPSEIVVTMNWFEELKRLAPAN